MLRSETLYTSCLPERSHMFFERWKRTVTSESLGTGQWITPRRVWMHRWLNSSYTHGIMDGEILEAERRGEIEMERVNIHWYIIEGAVLSVNSGVSWINSFSLVLCIRLVSLPLAQALIILGLVNLLEQPEQPTWAAWAAPRAPWASHHVILPSRFLANQLSLTTTFSHQIRWVLTTMLIKPKQTPRVPKIDTF